MRVERTNTVERKTMRRPTKLNPGPAFKSRNCDLRGLLREVIDELGAGVDVRPPDRYDLWPVAMQIGWLRQNQRKEGR
jgi:hypothetical protein